MELARGIEPPTGGLQNSPRIEEDSTSTPLSDKEPDDLEKDSE